MREMKDSGILGVGKVPISWEQTRLGYECYIRARLGWRGLKADEYVDEGYAFISAFNIQDGKLVWEPLNYITQERYDESPEIKLNIGDVLLVKDGAGVGKSARVDSLPCGGTAPNSSIGVITPYNSMSYRYVCYYIQSPVFSNFVGLLYNGMGVPHLTQEILKTIRILMPPLDEQQSICDYLDEKCAEFDTIKSDIQSQIEVLEEYKKSLVFRVVSKGIKKATLKNTASDVWTAIPEKWELIDIKYVFEIVKRIAGQEGFDVLSVTQKGLKVKDIESNNGQQAESYAGYQFVYPTDYVMNHMDLLTGWVDCSTMFGVTSPDYRVFRLRDKENNDLTYFKYVMQCCYMSRIFYSLGQGVSNLGRWRLQTSAFNNFMIPVPPLEEQREIAEYLDTKISEIDTIIADKQKQIETIEEYKKSLIFEYVTGKKEVPIWK